MKRPISPGQTGTKWTGAGQPKTDEADGFDENYFRRRPKSFYFEGRRFGGDPAVRMSHIADENYLRSMTMVSGDNIFLTINISPSHHVRATRATRASRPGAIRCWATPSLSTTATVRPSPGRRCFCHRSETTLWNIDMIVHDMDPIIMTVPDII